MKRKKTSDIEPLKLRLTRGRGEKAIEVSLRNVSTHSIAINKLMCLNRHPPASKYPASLILEVGTPSRGEVSWSVIHDPRWGSPSQDDFLLLGPGECYSQEEELAVAYLFFDEIGWYEITVEYENTNRGEQFGFNAWVGKLRSNSLKIYNDKILRSPFKKHDE